MLRLLLLRALFASCRGGGCSLVAMPGLIMASLGVEYRLWAYYGLQ